MSKAPSSSRSSSSAETISICVAELGGERAERVLVERLRRRGHLTEVEQDGDQRSRGWRRSCRRSRSATEPWRRRTAVVPLPRGTCTPPSDGACICSNSWRFARLDLRPRTGLPPARPKAPCVAPRPAPPGRPPPPGRPGAPPAPAAGAPPGAATGRGRRTGAATTATRGRAVAGTADAARELPGIMPGFGRGPPRRVPAGTGSRRTRAARAGAAGAPLLGAPAIGVLPGTRHALAGRERVVARTRVTATRPLAATAALPAPRRAATATGRGMPWLVANGLLPGRGCRHRDGRRGRRADPDAHRGRGGRLGAPGLGAAAGSARRLGSADGWRTPQAPPGSPRLPEPGPGRVPAARGSEPGRRPGPEPERAPGRAEPRPRACSVPAREPGPTQQLLRRGLGARLRRALRGLGRCALVGRAGSATGRELVAHAPHDGRLERRRRRADVFACRFNSASRVLLSTPSSLASS